MVYPHRTSRHLHLKVTESSKGQGQNHYKHSWNKSRPGAQETLLKESLFRLVTLNKNYLPLVRYLGCVRVCFAAGTSISMTSFVPL